MLTNSLTNSLIILNPKQMYLNPRLPKDKMEIENREKNTYYNKIINLNCDKNIKKIKIYM